jgi:putative transposase
LTIENMPSKNSLKIYVAGGHYHIYNRGVAKQDIFKDEQDYGVFLKYLKEALDMPVEQKEKRHVQGQSFTSIKRPVKNFKGEVLLIAYCLMPNHFHLLIKQNSKDSMQIFMRSIVTRFASYFNKKYERVGPLFQGRYKAVLIDKDNYLLHLTRYIHLNPSEFNPDLTKAYSSYSDYLGIKKNRWVTTEPVLRFFQGPKNLEFPRVNDYKSFVENYEKDSAGVLGELILE